MLRNALFSGCSGVFKAWLFPEKRPPGWQQGTPVLAQEAGASKLPTTLIPMLLQVPTIFLHIDSRGTSLESCCLTLAISYTCFAEMVATDWCPGR